MERGEERGTERKIWGGVETRRGKRRDRERSDGWVGRQRERGREREMRHVVGCDRGKGTRREREREREAVYAME